MIYYKAFIRVVKSLNDKFSPDGYFMGVTDVVREPLIVAENKAEVKAFLLEAYPQFFQNGKVYEKETKDPIQFFYVVIFELYEWERKIVLENKSWVCSHCGQLHENEYVSKPKMNDRLFGSEIKFCRTLGDEDHCMDAYKAKIYEGIDMPDEEYYVRKDSPQYIYKITEKSTGKSYIGKTRNEPFFRWWNHLKRNSSPFGVYFKSTPLDNWTFEVLATYPAETKDEIIFQNETRLMMEYDTINKGFNSLVSNRKEADKINNPELF